MWHVRLAKTQSSLSAWRKFGSLVTHLAHSENSDLTGRMPRLIWIFAGRKGNFVGFVMRRLICYFICSALSWEIERISLFIICHNAQSIWLCMISEEETVTIVIIQPTVYMVFHKCLLHEIIFAATTEAVTGWLFKVLTHQYVTDRQYTTIPYLFGQSELPHEVLRTTCWSIARGRRSRAILYQVVRSTE